MRYAIAVDIGGTCVDCVAVGPQGRLDLAKVFSTPPDFTVGIFNGLRALAMALGEPLERMLATTELFLHSTTVGENAIVDGTMADAGLITTRGFEDTLWATRGGYGRWSGLSESEKRDPIRTDKPPELIPRSLIRGVDDRLTAQGARQTGPDDAELERVVADLLAKGVTSIGICLLWSFLKPEIERRIASIVRSTRPTTFVSLSHEVAPTLGEYERTATTALNARLGPVVGEYLTHLEQELSEFGFKGTVLVMQSYGGLLPLAQASQRPLGTIESGPVAGVLGSKHASRQPGANNIIAADMGGTTFKVGIVRDGLTEYQPESMVFRYHFAIPKQEIESLGLAGGSIISVDADTGLPSIGPRSAGAYPGPVCYAHGGDEPTITDADAILGYLHQEFFLGGQEHIDIDAAREAFNTKVARPLGMTIDEAAPKMYRLANSYLYDLMHKVTVERGLDPAQFMIVSIGGTAGMHVSSYAHELGVKRIVIPRTASVHSAVGLIHSDIVHEELVTSPMTLPVDSMEIARIFDGLAGRIRDQLARDGFPSDQIILDRSIVMRYARQTHMLTVPVENVWAFDSSLLEKTVDRFEDLYRNRYGPDSGFREAGIELVGFRLRGTGRAVGPTVEEFTHPQGRRGSAVVERRRAWVDDLGEYREIDGYSFEGLRPGDRIFGPAIIWTPTTTVVLHSRDQATMDMSENLILERKPARDSSPREEER